MTSLGSKAALGWGHQPTGCSALLPSPFSLCLGADAGCNPGCAEDEGFASNTGYPGMSCRPSHPGKAKLSFHPYQHPQTVSCQEGARRKQDATWGQGLGYASVFPRLPQQHCCWCILRCSSLNGELHVLSFVHNGLSSRYVIIGNRKGTN